MCLSRGKLRDVVYTRKPNERRLNDKSEYDGTTVLMWVVIEGHTAIVERLLRSEADVNIQDNKGATALL